MINDEAARFLLEQSNETIRFLIGQKISYMNSVANLCMAWWVSSIVFYGSVLAAVWLKQAQLKNQKLILNLLGLVLPVLFLATAAFGVLIIHYSYDFQREIDTLVVSLGRDDNFFHTELTGFRCAMGFGVGSFLLITLIWMCLWCHLHEDVRTVAGSLKRRLSRLIRTRKPNQAK